MANLKNKADITFYEIQRFRQFWLWILLIAVSCLFWYASIQQIVFNNPFGSNPAPDLMLIIFWLLFGIGLPAFFYAIRLITVVQNNDLFILLFPIHLSFRKIERIQTFKTVVYRPLFRFGGWGMRYGIDGSKAYNVSGNRGVELTLSGGRKVLIGTQKPVELVEALDSVSELS